MGCQSLYIDGKEDTGEVGWIIKKEPKIESLGYAKSTRILMCFPAYVLIAVLNPSSAASLSWRRKINARRPIKAMTPSQQEMIDAMGGNEPICKLDGRPCGLWGFCGECSVGEKMTDRERIADNILPILARLNCSTKDPELSGLKKDLALKIADAALAAMGVEELKVAHVICCNDSVEMVVLGTREDAAITLHYVINEKIQSLYDRSRYMLEQIQRDSPHRSQRDAYLSRFYWHIHTVPIRSKL